MNVLTANRRSPGQQMVRTLAAQLMPEYRRTAWDQLDSLLGQLRTLLATNPIITTDAITAAPLGYGPFAASYLDWLLAVSARSERERFPDDIRLDQFVYRRPDNEPHQAPPRYLGGVKWESTMHGLLAIAAGEPMLRSELEARYFIRSGILTIAGGGNHRLLAYVLIGEPRIEADRFEWCEETSGPDEALNAALRAIEQLYPTGVQLALNIFDARELEAETRAAKGFVEHTEPEERSVIAAYIQDLEQQADLPNAQVAVRSLAGLLDCVEQLRMLRGQDDTEWIRRLRAGLPAERSRSAFADWYAAQQGADERNRAVW